MTDEKAADASAAEWRGHMYTAVASIAYDARITREKVEALVATPKTAPDEPTHCDREWDGMPCVRAAWHEDDGPHVAITPEGLPFTWPSGLVTYGCTAPVAGGPCDLPRGHFGPHWRPTAWGGTAIATAYTVGDRFLGESPHAVCGYAIGVGAQTWTCGMARGHDEPHAALDDDGTVRAVWRTPETTTVQCAATLNGGRCTLPAGHGLSQHTDSAGHVWSEDEPEPMCGLSCQDRPHLRCTRPRGHDGMHEAGGWSW